MRIGHLSNFSPRKLGSGEARIVALAEAAAQRGHAFTLFTRPPVHRDVSDALRRVGACWRDLGELESAPFRSSRKLARDFDVVQLNMVAPRSAIALAAYGAWPVPVLFVDRVSGPPEGFQARPSLVAALADRLTMLRVHQVAGITEYVRRRAQVRFGLPDVRTCTLYNGVDVRRFHPGQRLPLAGRAMSIVAVASLIKEKGLDVLLRALALLDSVSWQLSIAGAGREEGALKQLCQDLGLTGRVRFLGLRDDVDVLMRQADVFVHPATWQEALGNTVLEAMASGCCVIASQVGGIPELARDGVEALLVRPGDPDALRTTIEQVASDESLCHRLGAAARERVVRDFSLEMSIERTLDWYEAASQRRYFR